MIAVHGGAGVHPRSTEAEVKRSLKLACRKALLKLQEGRPSLDAVEVAITALEDAECLNAGYGSNLTIDGKVECDASIMDGSTGNYGSVGAISGFPHPIEGARAVLEYSSVPDPLGRIAPMILVGDGALSFARSRGLPDVPAASMIAPRPQQEWIKWKTALDSALSSQKDAVQMGAATSAGDRHAVSSDLRQKQDTVGAVSWDSGKTLAAGVSSGGLLLKHSGRIGEAAVYGAGCWARECSSETIGGVTCSVSGAGEDIIRAALAKTICDALETSEGDRTHAVVQSILADRLNAVRAGEEIREAETGLLLLVKERDMHDHRIIPRLWCAFTTESMAIAYASSLDPRPKALVLRRSSADRINGRPFYITALPLTRA
ncbi:N-terminal nucleophile aminohydrolase [Laetiporus sulphureus 93-53]|uniref:N-terminal nucleophile aminohydrolase n=1 Tax=Laetiporus sulphureus 93-53 TaxID=1314785 RepID=A0A165F440_9APHY|nr:N-terminal nucleophile aminohydrolase [Laetiporus sulphureus 93-53]KZT08342.1 N-terminal nucleophile aminohydrolase [Laetiporus sulphureus 93-53]